MKIAVVILNWNGKELLRTFLPALIRHTKQADLFVVDNASEDDSVQVLQREFPEIGIIQHSRNYGFAGGYNRALNQIPHELCVLLNSDVKVTARWLPPLIDIFEEQPQVVAIQPKIRDLKSPDYFEYAGAAGGFVDALGYPYCRGRIFDHLETDSGQYDSTSEIFWGSGACLVLRRKNFLQIGGFDEDLFAHQEEIDLCWRFRAEGYKIVATGASTVYHLGGGTLSQMHTHKTYLNFRNNLLILLKNLPASHLLPVLVLRLFLDGIAGVKFILDGKPHHCLAIVKAHGAFYRRFIRFYKKRGGRRKLRSYYKHRIILWSFYFKKRKTYHDMKI